MSASKEDEASALPDHCYLQISIAGEIQPQPIVIQLFQDTCPLTCRNFVQLCTSSMETSTTRQRPFPTYRGCEFHRVIDQFMVQTGDFERFDGTGGHSCLPGGNATFPDESLQGKHDQAGIVSMANKGKNTNGSQFFITLKATPHLDGKHVVFGRVGSGMEVVQKMVQVERVGDRPISLQRIVIVDCGSGMDTNTSDGTPRKTKHKRKRTKTPKRSNEGKKKKRKKRHSHEDSESSSYDSERPSSSSTDSQSREGRKKRKRSNKKEHKSKSKRKQRKYG